MKNILIINGYPYEESFSWRLHENYSKGACSAGHEVTSIYLKDLHFNLNLEKGYRQLPEIEPDLLRAQAHIVKANHLVFVYPVWWGTYPALMKGFIDRIFLPGFAFRFRPNQEHEKLLRGKSARLLVGMDSSLWTHKYSLGSPGETALKSGTLEFCGVQPVKITYFPEIRKASEYILKQWLDKVKRMGKSGI